MATPDLTGAFALDIGLIAWLITNLDTYLGNYRLALYCTYYTLPTYLGTQWHGKTTIATTIAGEKDIRKEKEEKRKEIT